ncbi:hypothetical protein GTO87_03525 [Ligilactobacillus saerimneri]|uniref:Uncharacterized protein n=1 Tax=Ligilactobacillus saerimneri TaxID=228229 RepID=A0A7H9EJG7_9LACO|nr:hypothetical protein [Ligilactobacillus saerimneri]QLL77751.1 hypothetical protein GTO87_03525 [Ligilactobacillus saerimneri]
MNIPTIVSLLALLLSIYSSINTFYEKHRKTKFYIRWCSLVGGQLDTEFLFTNLSSRPVTITRIRLITDCEVECSTLFPVVLLSREEKTVYSGDLPITISPRSSLSYLVAFQHLKDFSESNELTFDFMIDGKNTKKITLPANKYLSLQQLVRALESRMQ